MKYRNLDSRIVAVKELVKKTGKKPEEINTEDFIKNRLGGLLQGVYNGSPYAALKEAGYKFERWEGGSVGHNYWKNNKNERIRATKWLVERTGKKPEEINTEDFIKNRLSGFLNDFYNNSFYLALKEAGFDVQPKNNSKFSQRSSYLEQAVEEYIKPNKKSKSL